MKVLLNKNNVVIAKADDIRVVDKGFLLVKENIIFHKNLRLVETKLNPKVLEDILENGIIKENPQFKIRQEFLKKEMEV